MPMVSWWSIPWSFLTNLGAIEERRRRTRSCRTTLSIFAVAAWLFTGCLKRGTTHSENLSEETGYDDAGRADAPTLPDDRRLFLNDARRDYKGSDDARRVVCCGPLNDAGFAARLKMFFDTIGWWRPPPPVAAVMDPAKLICFIESMPRFAEKFIAVCQQQMAAPFIETT